MVETPAPDDPLLRHVPLAHDVTVPILGVPVRFRSNSAAALAAVHESFGRWVAAPGPGDPPPVPAADVRIILHPGTEARATGAPVTARMPDAERVLLQTAGSVALVDLRRGDAVLYVTAALLADAEHFRYSVLEGPTLVLVAARDRLPVHAAMIARAGRAVVLVGPSGRGKSTVAYAAMRRGWRVLADDAVYVQTSPALRVWGRPGHLYLPGDAGARFAELAGRSPTLLANGKLKFVVDTGPAEPAVPEAAICVLERGAVTALESIGPAELAAALLGELAPSHELYGDAPARVTRMLARDGGWRLTLAADPADAVHLLERLSPGAPTPAR
jgi:hypothetical protein